MKEDHQRLWRERFEKRVNSLFSGYVNLLTESSIRTAAENSKTNPENIALLSVSPKRLALYWVIAYLTLKIDFSQINNPTTFIESVYKNFVADNAELFLSLRKQLENINNEKDFFKPYHQIVRNELKTKVGEYIRDYQITNKPPLLPQTKRGQEKYAGVAGGVASGKTAAKERAKNEFGAPAMFVSSDEWHDILVCSLLSSDAEEVKQYQDDGGSTLSEAWFIKEFLWELFNESVLRPHVIQEAMNINTLRAAFDGGIVYVNTANPEHAVLRAEARGQLIQRYVASSSVVSSYRLHFSRLILGISGFALAECNYADIHRIKELVLNNTMLPSLLLKKLEAICLEKNDFKQLSLTHEEAQYLKNFLDTNNHGDISAKLLYRLGCVGSKLKIEMFDTDQLNPKELDRNHFFTKEQDRNKYIAIQQFNTDTLGPFAVLQNGCFIIHSLGRLMTLMTLEDTVHATPQSRDQIWITPTVNVLLIENRLKSIAAAGVTFYYQGKVITSDCLFKKMQGLNSYVDSRQRLFRGKQKKPVNVTEQCEHHATIR